MDLGKLFGRKEEPSLIVPSEFDVTLERRTATFVLQFEARVKGHFVAKKGKPDFVAETISLHGLPDLNIQEFCRSDMRDVRSHAIAVEFPKVCGKLRQ